MSERIPADLHNTLTETKESLLLPPEEVQVSDFLGLRDESIREIYDALVNENTEQVNNFLENLSSSDKAELLEKANRETRKSLMLGFAPYFDADVISILQEDVRTHVLEDMSAEQVAKILSDLDSDDALDIVAPLDPELQQEIMRKLSAKIRIALEEGLSFPEDSAGRLMQREFVAVPQFWTVGKTIDYLRAARDTLPDDFYDLIVIDPSHHVVGEIPLNRLVRSQRSVKIDDLTLEEVHLIPSSMDQEEVAIIFRNENLVSAPVVDDSGRLIGIITYDDVIYVIDEEAEEDLLKLAGVKEDDLYRNIISTASSRSRWLLINLLTAFLAASVISLFDATIEKIVALAVLMPIVAGMGGNAGTQAMTVAVRGIATNELSGTNAWRVIGKETAVGIINGVLFAALIGLIAGLWFQDTGIGAVIAAAMIINLIVAGFFGASIPVILNKFNIDPAVASSVFLTTMTDVIGFFAFLGLASIFLI
ncbi:MAG: magnesium transporter [Alphaproteobacteria bacterium]|jgi:magnesium transporter|nr:magnesium transporter [Alphaproteobacteria bacterium]MCB1551085.1 magnesium transporter [Alphaproteobacteria bacterium]MCB9985078.1 magnesium transporter [Micavibrio sp.]HRK97460.1 magnesium transporter [Alphaproteobacteria bacterium]